MKTVTTEKSKYKISNVLNSKKMDDMFNNSPFLIEKLKKANEILAKAGLPKEIRSVQ